MCSERMSLAFDGMPVCSSVDCCSLKPYKETKLTKDTTDNIAAMTVSWMSNTLQLTAL